MAYEGKSPDSDWIQLNAMTAEPDFPVGSTDAYKEGTMFYSNASGTAPTPKGVFVYTTNDGTATGTYGFQILSPNNNASYLTSGQLSGDFGGVPIGTIIFWAGTATSLTGYLPCNGASGLSATTYSALEGVIGQTWGGTAGVDFTLPDLRGQFIRGANTIGGTTGTVDPDSTRTFGSTQAFKMLSHRHWSASGNNNSGSYPGSTTAIARGKWGFGNADYDLAYGVTDPTNGIVSTPVNYSTFVASTDTDNTELRPVNVNAQFYIKY